MPIFEACYALLPHHALTRPHNPVECRKLLITSCWASKFPQASRQKLEAMLGLSGLKETRFYQEAEQEGERKAKLESVLRLLQMGLPPEQIAMGLNLPIEDVRQAAASE